MLSLLNAQHLSVYAVSCTVTLIRKWVEKGEKPELKEIIGESITVKSMWAQFDQLTIIDDVHLLVRRLEGLNTILQVYFH
jgi:hypothetical protein